MPKTSKTKGKAVTRQDILNAVARLEAAFDGMPPRDQVAIIAGYPNSLTPGCVKMLSTLKREGMILYDKTMIKLTPAGRKKTATVDNKVTTNGQFHDCIRELLSVPKYRQAFEFLIDGSARSKEELADELGYPNCKTPGFMKMLSQIRKHAYVGGEKDVVQIKDEAFPFGRNNP